MRPTSKHSYHVFLSLSKVSVLEHFQESILWLFLIQTFISLVIHFPFKWPRQEAIAKHQQNKTTFTATRSQECSPWRTAVSQQNFFWRVVAGTLRWLASLHCLFCLAQTSCPIFLKLKDSFALSQWITMLYPIRFLSDNFRASSVRNRSASLPFPRSIRWEHERAEGAMLHFNISPVAVSLFLILIARESRVKFQV